MRRRVLILPLAAAILAGLAIWRTHWEATRRAQPRPRMLHEMRLAPRFLLYDQSGSLVKFERYLGRTRMVLFFTGPAESLDREETLAALAKSQPQLESQGIQVIVVTAATPFAVRETEKLRGATYPFPVLTDIDHKQPAPLPVHREWGRYDESQQSAMNGLFLIDRAGRTAFQDGKPQPVGDAHGVLNQLAAGDWPEGF